MVQLRHHESHMGVGDSVLLEPVAGAMLIAASCCQEKCRRCGALWRNDSAETLELDALDRLLGG